MRPRERYSHLGPGVFGDAELVALVLGTGTSQRAVGEIAAGLLARFEDLEGLANAHPGELAREVGVGPARAVRLHAALQAGRRSLRQRAAPMRAVDSAERAREHLAPALRGLLHEELHALYLDRRLQPLARRMLTTGSDAFTVVDPRQIFREALHIGASAVVLAHNHPSGDPTPSSQDLEVTERVAQAGAVVGVSLLDHLIIAGDRWRSLATEGLFVPSRRAGPTWTA
ncbi:MAG: DNA repair protein RadC [Deltaproteobacteria bacterium]|nr:DNA repair protein RadC [Deltaproteobacteria bacterium]